MNIVFSTTRQWNPGDEFILLGTINLLQEYFEQQKDKGIKNNFYFNPIIYNRNPQIRRARKRDFIKMIDNFLGKDFIEKFRDNSVKDRKPMDYTDLVVFAGSPEWIGRRLKKLYTEILNNKIPTIFLGLGTDSKIPLEYNNKDFGSIEKKVFEQYTKIIITRDENTLGAFKHFEFAKHLPCPALFCSKTNNKKVNVKKIALIYSTVNAEGGNDISLETYNFILALYKELLYSYKDEYEFEFISHYIDELSEFKKDFPEEKIRYSYDSKDYLDIYSEYDLVIGCRVHGIGMCASLGIPGIMVSHDGRSKTVKGFLADRIFIDNSFLEIKELFENVVNNIEDKSQELLEHKKIVKMKYLELFNKYLNI
ncbi:polysaccharide pyruvyl transferase family protein [Aliarcobacter butzleri]|nr:polysaccharide pyruvyl transferase family protein [Aliarcobacter butzleri]